MNILIAAVHWPVASGRYMRDAFRRLGHDVRTVGYHMGEPDEIWGLRVDTKYVWQPDYQLSIDEHGDYRYLFYLDNWRPDLVLQMDTHLEYTGNWIRQIWPNVPLAIYSVDNHVRDLTKLGTDFDHYFMAHHDGPAMPVDESNPKHHWLPCAYDPAVFTPSPIPMAERKWDVAMVGIPYEGRVKTVNAMQEAGLKVFAGYGLLYEEYRDIYHNAKISLCVSAAGDVAQRVFETAAMGCVILSDALSDGARLDLPCHLYQAKPPYETEVGAAVGIAQFLLNQGIEHLEMRAGKAKAWALPHTWDARAQTILNTIFGDKK